MKIRQANNADIPLLAELIRTAFRDVADRFELSSENAPTHPSNCTSEWIKSAMEKGVRYYILESGDTLLGCAALEQAKPEICYLERLSVLPQFRRKGLGEALVNHIKSEAKRIRARRIEIGIIAEQTDLKDWYIKRGFSVKNTVSFAHLPFQVMFMFTELL